MLVAQDGCSKSETLLCQAVSHAILASAHHVNTWYLETQTEGADLTAREMGIITSEARTVLRNDNFPAV